jgi:hypothetical protein
VNQTSTGGSNQSHVHQDVKQKAKEKGSASQTQDAYQSADVDQEATGSGDNSSKIHQHQNLSAKGSAANQDQNTTFGPFTDCAFAPGSAFSPNACSDVSQSSEDGENESDLKQSISEDARTSAAGASQQQGSFNGGINGRVHQDTVTGRSTSKADQNKQQRLSGPEDSFQRQFDPISCCGFSSQDGGENNSEDIQQSSTQQANHDAAQQSALFGSSRSPDGDCSVRQKASNNADSGDNAASADPCPALLLVTSCVAGGGGGDFTGSDVVIQQEGGCVESPPVGCDEEFCGPTDGCEICLTGGGFNAVGLGRQNR